MIKQKNTITFNGKLFDAVTGQLISDIPQPSAQKMTKHTQSIDGVVRKPARAMNHHGTLSVNKNPPQPAHNSKDVHSRHQHAKTLMRGAVSKPKKPKTVVLSTQIKTDPAPKHLTVHATGVKTQLSLDRHQRAQDVIKSKKISRFSQHDINTTFTKKTAALKVKSSPHGYVSHHHDSPIPPDSPISSATELFTNALGSATGHEQTLSKPTRHSRKHTKKLGLNRRFANVSLSILFFLVLGGFIAYQNLTNMAMHVASSKAGINATLPGYRPAGFTINRQIQAAPGQIVINVRSNSDQRNFNITQSASSWNSKTLLDNYVSTKDQPYQEHNQANGKTVFTYGGANATWVDGGIWYKIEGESLLSNDQLLKIANSF